MLGRTTGTHTYVLLEVPKAVYDDIRKRLEDAGYQHAFDQHDGRDVIDMSGIALAEAPIAEQSRELKETMLEFKVAHVRSIIRDLGPGLAMSSTRRMLERRIEIMIEEADDTEWRKLVPTDEILMCPNCEQQHLDLGEFETRVHRKHRCENTPAGKTGCGYEWIPDAKPTRGIR